MAIPADESRAAAARAALTELARTLERTCGERVAGLVLHGPLVRGAPPRERGDIGLILAADRVDEALLDAVAHPLRTAWRAVGAEAMITTPDEVRAAADVFPVRFLAIQREHEVLLGRSPLDGISIRRDHLRLRVEQELRNLSLRLRRRIVDADGDAAALRSGVAAMRPAIALALWGLCELVGSPAPNQEPAAVFAAVAGPCDLDRASVDALASPRDDGVTVARALTMALERAVAIVDGLPAS